MDLRQRQSLFSELRVQQRSELDPSPRPHGHLSRIQVTYSNINGEVVAVSGYTHPNDIEKRWWVGRFRTDWSPSKTIWFQSVYERKSELLPGLRNLNDLREAARGGNLCLEVLRVETSVHLIAMRERFTVLLRTLCASGVALLLAVAGFVLVSSSIHPVLLPQQASAVSVYIPTSIQSSLPARCGVPHQFPAFIVGGTWETPVLAVPSLGRCGPRRLTDTSGYVVTPR